MSAEQARAWAEGYAAGRRDQALSTGYITTATANPYPTAPWCKDHRPVQHRGERRQFRDRKGPWCPNCGRNDEGTQVVPHDHMDVGGGYCRCGAELCSLPGCDGYCVHPDGWLSWATLQAMKEDARLKALQAVATEAQQFARETSLEAWVSGASAAAAEVAVVTQVPATYCDHPRELRAVLSGRLVCGQCGVILSDTELDPDVCGHPLSEIHGDGTCGQCGTQL